MQNAVLEDHIQHLLRQDKDVTEIQREIEDWDLEENRFKSSKKTKRLSGTASSSMFHHGNQASNSSSSAAYGISQVLLLTVHHTY